MSPIRPLQRGDLPAVADLYEQVMRSGSAHAPPGLAPAFARTLLDHPAADPDIPSLVHADGAGRITGFIGSNVRRLRAHGRPVRMACSGPLVSAPDARNTAVGALLLRAYLRGPQDLSVTDGATRAVQQLWERLGGHTAHLRCVVWTRVFQPWGVGGDALLARRGVAGRQRLRPLLRLLDVPTARVAQRALRVARPDTAAEVLTPAVLVEELPALPPALRPDYDAAFLEWLFDEMAAVATRGPLVPRLVRARDGTVLGWYVAYLPAGRIGQVMHVAAPGGAIGRVVDHLLHDAWRRGAAAVQGRLEPQLLQSLSQRRCLLHAGDPALVHSRDPDLLAALAIGTATISRMDGEWWMGHHLEPFAANGR